VAVAGADGVAARLGGAAVGAAVDAAGVGGDGEPGIAVEPEVGARDAAGLGVSDGDAQPRASEATTSATTRGRIICEPPS
jgi:hypothetical protein